jgi:hypothetical protein
LLSLLGVSHRTKARGEIAAVASSYYADEEHSRER